MTVEYSHFCVVIPGFTGVDDRHRHLTALPFQVRQGEGGTGRLDGFLTLQPHDDGLGRSSTSIKAWSSKSRKRLGEGAVAKARADRGLHEGMLGRDIRMARNLSAVVDKWLARTDG